jgi:hypothetical protein
MLSESEIIFEKEVKHNNYGDYHRDFNQSMKITIL